VHMEMVEHSAGPMRILELHGRLDAHTVAPVQAWLERATAGPEAQILVNLADVAFIDSTALGTLVQGLKRCRQGGGDLRLCCLQRPVRMIFELTRLDRAFTILTDEELAV